VLGNTVRDVLLRTIEAVARERGGQYKEAFAAVEVLLAEYGEASLANRLVADIPLSVSWEVIADVIGILEWGTSDNGAAVHREVEQWLIDGQDLRKMQIALNLGGYPFLEEAQMYEVLERLSVSVPEIKSRCCALIEERKLHIGAKKGAGGIIV
jgi:hypothetical protein